jgi:rRNA maturation endonuclease Nob1
VSSTDSARKVVIAGQKGGSTVMIPEEYACDLCGCIFLPVNVKNIFCPSCGSSQVKKEMGSNELSDEDVYVGILDGKEKISFLF